MIQVRGLTKVYGDVKAIDDVGFEVKSGEIVGLLGPNGAGKSTTMRILAGAMRSSSGVAKIAGIDVDEDPTAVKRLVGYLPETPPLYTEMTVRSFLLFAGRIKETSNVKVAVERVIEQVGLTEVAHRIIGHLSKGYRQRVGIAQALVHQPKLLILDEPASGLDPAQRVEIRELVQALSDGDTTIILSTHVLPEIESLCDRVVILLNGRVVATDTLTALRQQGRSIEVSVARPDNSWRTAMLGLKGVVAVSDTDENTLRIQGSRDLREDVAAASVSFGLLSLVGKRGLEDIYLAATKNELRRNQ